jgi:hypothetical protein
MAPKTLEQHFPGYNCNWYKSVRDNAPRLSGLLGFVDTDALFGADADPDLGTEARLGLLERPLVDQLLQDYTYRKKDRENDKANIDPTDLLNIATDTALRSLLLTTTKVEPSPQIPPEILHLAITAQLVFELILTAPDVFTHTQGREFHEWDIFRAYQLMSSSMKARPNRTFSKRRKNKVAAALVPGAPDKPNWPDSAAVLAEFSNESYEIHELKDTDALPTSNTSPLPYAEAAKDLGINLLFPSLSPKDNALVPTRLHADPAAPPIPSTLLNFLQVRTLSWMRCREEHGRARGVVLRPVVHEGDDELGRESQMLAFIYRISEIKTGPFYPTLVICKPDTLECWVSDFRIYFQFGLTLRIFYGQRVQEGDVIRKPLILETAELKPFLDGLDEKNPATERTVIITAHRTWVTRASAGNRSTEADNEDSESSDAGKGPTGTGLERTSGKETRHKSTALYISLFSVRSLLRRF